MRERDTLDITLADIAEQSGSNAALVKYYFGSKEGLLFAVLENDIASSLEAIEKLLDSGLPPEEMMRKHLTGLVEAYYRIPYLNRLIHSMSRDATSARIRDVADNFVKPITVAQARILKAGIATGVFRKVDPTCFYFQTTGAASALYSQRFVLKAALGVDHITARLHKKYVRQLVDTFMVALSPEV